MAESTKIILEIDVNDGDLQALNTELQKTSKSFKDVEKNAGKASKSVDDVTGNGGAIAILDQLTGGLATRLKDAYEASKLFSVSLKGVRTALIATGIGAFVVAVGLLVAYWSDISDYVNGTNRALEQQRDLINETITEGKKRLSQLELEQKILETREKIFSDEKDTVEEIRKKRIDLLRLQLAEQLVLLDKATTNLEIEKSLANQITLLERSGGIGGRGSRGDAKPVITEEEQKRIDEAQTALDNLRLSSEQTKLLLQDLLFPDEPKGEETGTQGDKVFSIFGEPVFNFTTGEFETKLNALRQGAVMLGDFQAGMDNTRIAGAIDVEKAVSDAAESGARYRTTIAQREAEAKIAAQDQWLSLAMNVSSLIGKETMAGKALAIATTTVSTYLSAQQAYQSQLSIPTPDAPARAAVAAGIAIVAGLKNVQAILSVKVPGGGGGGGGVNIPRSNSFSGGGGVPAPQFNVVGNSGVNQLANSIGDQLGQPLRAFVTVGDVSTAQQLDRDSIRESSLG